MKTKRSEFDAVIVPGGGLQSTNELPLWVECRLEKAKEMRGEGTIITLSAGTSHKPLPTDAEGHPVFESVVAAEWLAAQGVPADKVLADIFSYDTIGNAFFARKMHTLPAGFRNLLVITNEFHLPRTEAIFEWIFSLDGGAQDYSLEFFGVPDVGMEDDALEERHQREAKSLSSVRLLAEKLTSVADVHRWLFTEHEVYSATKKPKRASGSILDTY